MNLDSPYFARVNLLDSRRIPIGPSMYTFLQWMLILFLCRGIKIQKILLSMYELVVTVSSSLRVCATEELVGLCRTAALIGVSDA